MLAKIFSAAVSGVDAYEVEVAVNAGGNPSLMAAIGLTPTIEKNRQRVVVAIQNSGYRCPGGWTTLELTPSEAPKEGLGLDLPIALAMTAVGEEIPLTGFNQCCFIGELATDGSVRPVGGIFPIALEAKRRGRQAIIVPEENAPEAAAVEGIATFGVRNLRQAFDFLRGRRILPKAKTDCRLEGFPDYGVDFADVPGHQAAKRAMEVAVAGGHHLLIVGSSGPGRTMLVKRIPTIMPPMTYQEALEVTRIHSIHGFLSSKRPFLSLRPFRSPHSATPDSVLLGGGWNSPPGEATLAHHGVLFLEELQEYHRSTLETLGDALEFGKFTPPQSKRDYPAEFMFIGALAPCPCGFFGDPKRECRCSAAKVQRYRQRISPFLLERIDLKAEVSTAEHKEVSPFRPADSSAVIRERVMAARAIQTDRFGAAALRCNARMSRELVKRHCQLDQTSRDVLRCATEEMELGPGAGYQLLKVARTIADLSGATNIEVWHLNEAIQYRALDRMNPGA